MDVASNEHTNVDPHTILKYMHKLVLCNIIKFKYITHPNGTHLMSIDEFKHYYNTPTKIEKNALDYTIILMPQPMCTSTPNTHFTKHLAKSI